MRYMAARYFHKRLCTRIKIEELLFSWNFVVYLFTNSLNGRRKIIGNAEPVAAILGEPL